MFAWIALALVLVAGGAFVTNMIITDLKKDREILELEKENLERDVKERDVLIEQQRIESEAFMEKAEKIVEEIGILQRKMARNALTRQSDFESMVTRRPNDGSAVDIETVEQKANSGMNKLFSDLEIMSREGVDAKTN